MKLFIIGNGFDVAHGIPSRYCNFRDWMESKLIEAFPELEQNGHLMADRYPVIPDYVIGHHGEVVPNEEDSMYLLMWLLLNTSMDADWNQFESALHDLDLKTVLDSYDDVFEMASYDKEDDINCFWLANNYEDGASNILEATRLIRKLFSNWIRDVDISCVPMANIQSLVDQETLFLTFNYTETLEKVYKVPFENVNHMHGIRLNGYTCSIVTDKRKDAYNLIIGHGNDALCHFDIPYYEADSILEEAIMELRKPVKDIIVKNEEYWETLQKSSITEVYSFGFSYSDVDLPYIRKIISVIDSKKVVWYLQSYDDTHFENGVPKNTIYERIIMACGFQGRFDKY